jgi:EAL domain-containing protein (putative c-di-GMP-specific phosphodiesterase class I)
VETAEQDREVTALQSDFSQGFYFARPMPADMVHDLAPEDEMAWAMPV